MITKRHIIPLLLCLLLLLSIPAFASAEEVAAAEEPATVEESAVAEEPAAAEESTAADETYVKLRQDHGVYLHGNGDGTFRPDASLTRAEASTILYNLLADQSLGSLTVEYEDVVDGTWFATPIRTLASLGLYGEPTGAFRPDEPMLRSELVELLARTVPAGTEATSAFSDVPPEDPLYPAVSIVTSRGWIVGYEDGTFRPSDSLTRAQAATIFNRMLGRSADPEVCSTDYVNCFTDIQVGQWFYGDILEAAVEHSAQREGDRETWLDYPRPYTVRMHMGSQVTEVLVKRGGTLESLPQQDAQGRAITAWVTGTNADAELTASISADTDYYALFAQQFASDHWQYAEFFSDGYFRPAWYATRSFVCNMFYTQLASKSRGSYSADFSDVADGAAYAEAARTLASLGLLDTAKGFRADDYITRGELASLFGRLKGAGSSTRSFSDLETRPQLQRAAAWAVDQGWIEDVGDGAFHPNRPLTRAQVVVAVNGFLGRRPDTLSASQMDSRFLFPDVPADHPAFADIMEATVAHNYTMGTEGESWSRYWRARPSIGLWMNSDQVVNASVITNSVGYRYLGNWSYNYNMDYSAGRKEAFVNGQGYTSRTNYLVWVSIQNQKVYIFTGSKWNWKLYKTFVVATGAPGHDTPVGVTTIYGHQTGFFTDHYSCYNATLFYPVSDYAFHSRLHKPHGGEGWVDTTIGMPVSKGCIRMFDEDAVFMYKQIPLYTTVVIY
ncbi:MAG: S-layer homology domain-containing protein [Oscillospiraceae bacterium]|nr:S-layer homology domain-containing protein [Oscillospiraceae bacterium]